MKLILMSLLLTSCANESLYYRMTTKETTCPKNYIYNSKDGMCYYSIPPRIGETPKKKLDKKKKINRDNEAVNCVKLINKVKQCGIDI